MLLYLAVPVSLFIALSGCVESKGQPASAQKPAQAVIQEGKPYAILSSKAENAGKVVVRDFFWYGCGHCFQAMPDLDKAYNVLKSKDVAVEHVPVPANNVWAIGATAYYALKAQGMTEAQHKALFTAIHTAGPDQVNSTKKEEFIKWAGKNGFDTAKVEKAWDSKEVAKQVADAKVLANAYGLKGTPAVGINGQALVTGESAKGNMGRAVLRAVEDLQK